MVKKKNKKLCENDIIIEYCRDNYEGDWIAMAHDAINPHYKICAS